MWAVRAARQCFPRFLRRWRTLARPECAKPCRSTGEINGLSTPMLPGMLHDHQWRGRALDRSRFSAEDLAVFWGRVDAGPPRECWLWTGQKDRKGYGKFRGIKSHRLAYALFKGAIPDGPLVRHSCDNPGCCNPAHLLLGTNADNSADAVERNRLARGERHGKSRLTDAQVVEIRANPDRLTMTVMAVRYGVSLSTISYVVSGRSHKRAA